MVREGLLLRARCGAGREREGDQARLQEPRAEASPRPEPGEHRRGGEVQGGVGRVRRARRRREAQGVRRGPPDGRGRVLTRWCAGWFRCGSAWRLPVRLRRRQWARRHPRRALRPGRAQAGTATDRSAPRSGSGDRAAPRFRGRDPRRHQHGSLHRGGHLLHVSRIGCRTGDVPRDLPAVRGLGCRRGEPGSVLGVAGLPQLRWPRSGDPDSVPHVFGARRRSAAAHGQGARPRGRRRRATYPGQGPRWCGNARRRVRRPLRRRVGRAAPHLRAPRQRPHRSRADHVPRGRRWARRSRCPRSTRR